MTKQGWNIDMIASCVEIYNEVIRDLLGDKVNPEP